GAPGPHGFAVRVGTARLKRTFLPHARCHRVHRSPHSTYRDDAYAPLHEAGCSKEDTDRRKGEAEYFSRAIWTREISLNRLDKFASRRRRFRAHFETGRAARRGMSLRFCPSGKSLVGRALVTTRHYWGARQRVRAKCDPDGSQ